MIVGEPDNKKILFFQEIPKRIHLHSNCEKIKFLGQFGVRWTLRVMSPLNTLLQRSSLTGSVKYCQFITVVSMSKLMYVTEFSEE